MFLDIFEARADIAREFQIDESELEGYKILFAAYKYEDYSGSALVILSKDGKLFEVNGSHCSCMGLEGQWSPEETSLEVIRMRDLSYYGFEKDTESILLDILFEKEVLEV